MKDWVKWRLHGHYHKQIELISADEKGDRIRYERLNQTSEILRYWVWTSSIIPAPRTSRNVIHIQNVTTWVPWRSPITTGLPSVCTQSLVNCDFAKRRTLPLTEQEYWKQTRPDVKSLLISWRERQNHDGDSEIVYTGLGDAFCRNQT